MTVQKFTSLFSLNGLVKLLYHCQKPLKIMKNDVLVFAVAFLDCFMYVG